jgi:CRP-like cAMP-binding protein
MRMPPAAFSMREGRERSAPTAAAAAIVAIVSAAMPSFSLDPYVVDVLMPDLVGHDRRPAAFVVYLFLLRATSRARGDTVEVSLQTIAAKTGLSKSSVQTALRHLKRRGLVDPKLAATTLRPTRRVLRPWRRA